ncbi:MAG: SLC13 family permease [Candidatus Thorarchaeota archaeon]|jgi:Na+/H+ antiporter NhaD/arsenite permease-like protein
MDIPAVLVLVIFIVTLVVIMSEKIDETATALFGMSLAGVVLLLGKGISFNQYIMLIDWASIMFIAGMLIIVAIAASSGMFQYISLLLMKRTRGEPRKVFLTFMVFVLGISMFLDPLPTMLVMGTFTVDICNAINMDFRPLLISEVVVANFASIPTIVGSVPNLVIALVTEINAGLLLIVMMPLVLILFFTTIPILLWYFRDAWPEDKTYDTDFLFQIPPGSMIKSRRDFYLSLIAMTLLLVGFTMGFNVSMVALLIASGMLVFSQRRAKEFIRQLSWDTLFFLIGLFGLVVALIETNIVAELGEGLIALTGGNILIAIIFMIWIPGFALSPVDNIPVAAVLSTLATEFGSSNPVVPMALMVGTNIGGYAIPFGDAPNMIAMNLAEKGQKRITFMQFTKVALPLAILHLIISTIYCALVVLLFSLLAPL